VSLLTLMLLLGPSSFLSICSAPGLEWVMKRTGEPSFVESARSLAMSITKRLKLQRSLGWSRASEPNPDTAWKYCKGLELHDSLRHDVSN
jgi:hypothetical protein